MRRSVIAVAVVCLLVAFSTPAATHDERVGRGKDDPITRIVKVIKKAVRSLGDGLTGPRP
ncbi:MAG TPA: hypothetical protein VE974_02820 [Thermoanaerobaculia bacterium]|nr:hypothetical protein [Thermoanaerobaculia bacterium]